MTSGGDEPIPPKEIEHVSDVFMIDPDQQSWLRSFPLLTCFGDPEFEGDAALDPNPIPILDAPFWQVQTESLEALALTKVSDLNIDGMFYEVTMIINEDLKRFDPLINYSGQYMASGDPERIEFERNVAECVKRDLAWMMVEWLIDSPGFFTSLRSWYDAGRWPHGWEGEFPTGRIIIS